MSSFGSHDDLPVAPDFDGHLAVIGDLLEDVVVWLEAPIVLGTDNVVTVHRARGGSAANVAVAASERVASRFIGRIGDDAAGSALVAELEHLGVDVRVRRAGRTGTVVALVDAAAERTLFADRAAAAELDEIPSAWLPGTAVLHVPAYGFSRRGSRAAILAAIDEVRASGGVVTLDASATSLIEAHGLAAFRALIDEISPSLLFANAAEAQLLGLDRTPPSRGTAYVVKDGPRAAVVLGPHGEVARVAPEPVEAVKDTTGAGDAFAGGFLSAWMTGTSLAGACSAGHTAAAQVLTTPGASHRTGRGAANLQSEEP